MKYALVALLLMSSITDANAYYYHHYHPYHRTYYHTYYRSYYHTYPVYTYPYYQPYRPYCLVQVLGLGICW
jgi:hypothetical protein